MTAVHSLPRFEPFEPTWRDDALAIFEALRDQAPVYRAPSGMYVVSRYETIQQLLRERAARVRDGLVRRPRRSTTEGYYPWCRRRWGDDPSSLGGGDGTTTLRAVRCVGEREVAIS